MNVQELSLKVIRAIIQRYPEWDQYATGLLEGLIMEVPALENPSMGRGLLFWSDGAGIQVAMDDDHDHFFPWDYDSDASLVRDLCEFVRNLVQEKLISAMFKIGDTCIGSCWIEPGEDVRSAMDHQRRAPPTLVRLRSWRGTYDQEISL